MLNFQHALCLCVMGSLFGSNLHLPPPLCPFHSLINFRIQGSQEAKLNCLTSPPTNPPMRAKHLTPLSCLLPFPIFSDSKAHQKPFNLAYTSTNGSQAVNDPSSPLNPWVSTAHFPAAMVRRNRRENVREREEMEERNQKNFGDNLGGRLLGFLGWNQGQLGRIFLALFSLKPWV